MPKIGRPRSCTCGECAKCKRAAYMRDWWGRLTPAEKRAKTARRDPALVREQARRKMARRRVHGTVEQKQRIAARAAVRDAIRRGDLERQPCENCGAEKGHAHHADHTKPLDVRWFCRRCHDLHHVVLADLEAAA